MALSDCLKALSNSKRMQILHWLRDPRAHFREQRDGDLVEDGVCGVLIAEKLNVSQPTVTQHMQILQQAGLVRSKRVKQWTFYQRDEERIAELKNSFAEEL
jgi:DNA-binding transcriptional ArsR family regulator